MKQKNTFKSFGNTWMAFAFLIVGLGLTILITYHINKNVEARAKAEFALVCNEIEVKIEMRLHAHAQLLRTGAAFFAASDTVTSNKWSEFINQAKIEKNLPGIQGVGFSLVIPKNQLQQHIKNIRNEGFPDYTIKPSGEREIYTSIIYLEPFTERNIRDFGYDMFSEPVRRKAMEQARDNDVAMLSGKVKLVQETDQNVQPGTLMYVPVYRNGMPVNTVEQRRAAIRGWVYSPYRMDDLMQGMLGSWDLLQIEKIHLQVYDDSISTNSILFDSQEKETEQHTDSPSRMLCIPIDFNGKNWALCFTQSDKQLTYFDLSVILVLGGGIVISFLGFVLFLILINTKTRALQIAQKLTAELKLSETKFKTVADYTYDWEYWEGKDRRLIYISPSCERISGYKPAEFLADNMLLQKIVHPDDLKLLYAHYTEVHSPEKYHEIDEIDLRIIKKDGSLAIIGHVCTPIFDENGNYLGRRISYRDITARKHAEELLMQTRRNYETFFNSIDDLLFVLDEQGNIIHANSTVIKRLGYSWEELSGQSVLMVHPPERREEAGRIVGEMLQGITEFCPVPVLTKSGIQIPVETRITPGFWDGRPVIFGVTKDISKLKLSEEKFSKLFHLNPSAAGLSDLITHRYIEVNDAFYTLFGFDKDEVIGKTAYELGIFTDEVANSILLFADSKGNVSNIEADLKTKDGSIKHTIISSENIYVQDKHYRFTVVHNITEIKNAKEALRESSQKFEAIISASPDGIGMASLDGKIQLMSEKLVTIYGYSAHEKDGIIGKSLFGFIDESNHKLLIENIHNLLVGEKNQKITEYLAIKKDNSRFYIDVNSTLLFDSNGNPESILFVERDITDRKKAEQEIQHQNEELKKLNATKDKFFSIIAHDLKSPFNGILGFSELLKDEARDLDIDSIVEYAGIIHASVKHTFVLLENLLDWARMQQGRIPFEPQEILFNGIVNTEFGVLKNSADQKNIKLIKNIDENLIFTADENMLSTVLRNLVSNAIKFTPKGGEVKVEARVEGDDVKISVCDTGIGIKPETIEKLFKIETSFTTRGTENEKGTGLGLLLCKEFIEKHGGRIWVESEQGQGSIFSFVIPKTH
jgi:PAS domain S-box-containing protein